MLADGKAVFLFLNVFFNYPRNRMIVHILFETTLGWRSMSYLFHLNLDDNH